MKMFLESGDKQVLTAVDMNGFTCAHIAAIKGSWGVVNELMTIDKVILLLSNCCD